MQHNLWNNKKIKIKKIVTNSNLIDFWTSIRVEKLKDLANFWGLDENKTKDIIEKIVAYDKKPLRNEIIEIMKNKPSLMERAKKGEQITKAIISTTDEMLKIK